jgi:hypothetical protein
VRVAGPAASRLRRISLFRPPDTTRGPADFPVQWADLPPKAGHDEEHIWIRQDFPHGGSYQERFHFVMLASAVGASYRTEVTESGPQLVFTAPPAGEVTVYLTMVSTRDVNGGDGSPLAEAKRRVARAIETGFAKLLSRSSAWWAGFWSQALISLPDKRIEQAWYLLFHQLACSARTGRQAPGLCGLWVPGYATPWGGDYHLDQNTQMMFWGCFTNNHTELAKPYMELLESWVPRARWRAKEVYQTEGIRWPLASDAQGNERCPPQYAFEHWCQGAAASHFWFYYQHTQDEEWLRKTGYPILRDSLRFYETYMTRDEKGRWRIHPSIPPETRAWATNPTADLAVIRLLLRACIEASTILGAHADRRDGWRAMLRDLSPYPLAGEGDEQVLAFSETHPRLHAVHPSPLAPIFPGNDIGLDSPPGQLAIGARTLRAFMDIRDETGKVVRTPVARITHGRGWMCIAAARLGLGKETGQLLDDWLTTFFQHNGLTQAWESRVVAMEPIATDAHTFTTAIGEMLLQSYNGEIRLFPSVPPDWQDCRFHQLRAVGAFLVSAERRGGRTAYAVIRSLAGQKCVVANPWPSQEARVVDAAGKQVAGGNEATLAFGTMAGMTYVVEPVAAPAAQLPPVRLAASPAQAPRAIAKGKHFGLTARPAGRPFAAATAGKMVNVEAINDGVIREMKKWPGPVHLPAMSVCRVEPLYQSEPFQAHFGIEYGEPRQVRKITAWAGSGYCSVFGGVRLSWVPRAYVLQAWQDGHWVDIPGTKVRDNEEFPIEHAFEPLTTTKVRLLVTETGTGIFARKRGEPRRNYHNAALMELVVE